MKLVELFDLCLRVNTETKATTFINFSGHVNSVSVRIYPLGWISEDALIETYNEYLIQNTGMMLKFNDWKTTNYIESLYYSFYTQETDKIEEIKNLLEEILNDDDKK